METVLMWLIGAVAGYFILVFLVTLLVTGCGIYFLYRITR